MHIYGDYRQCTWNVIKRFVPLDYKEDQILSSVKDEATSGAGHSLTDEKYLSKAQPKRNKAGVCPEEKLACFEYKKSYIKSKMIIA